MKLENGERKNRGGEQGDERTYQHFLLKWMTIRGRSNVTPNSVCVIYLRPAIGECVIHSPYTLFSFLLQELIEVDSDVVFELASYILQVRYSVFVCVGLGADVCVVICSSPYLAHGSKQTSYSRAMKQFSSSL